MAAVRLQRADASHVHDIWRWRNDAVTRAMSRNTEEIPWGTHTAWYARMLNDASRHLYIAWLGEEEKLGMCRFDIDAAQQAAEVSLILDPAARGRRFSKDILNLACADFLRQQPLRLRAYIRKDNAPSLRCFCQCGFKLETKGEPFMCYAREPA